MENKERFSLVEAGKHVYTCDGTRIVETIRVLCDKETGVEYLNYNDCVLPLLDREGKPKINKDLATRSFDNNISSKLGGIKFNVLEKNKMLELGFEQCVDGGWLYDSVIRFSYNYENYKFMFSLFISADGRSGNIKVLDCKDGLIYDFNRELKIYGNWTEPYKVALKVKERVEKILYAMSQAGVISGWEFGMKI